MNMLEVLGYGAIGLGGLMGYLAFRLLAKEQRREKPRKIIFTQVYIFMAFSVLIFLIGCATEITKSLKIKETKQHLEITQKELASAQKQLGSYKNRGTVMLASWTVLQNEWQTASSDKTKLELANKFIKAGDWTKLNEQIPMMDSESPNKIKVSLPNGDGPDDLL